ncbi:MAG: DUF1788 domain-containing protein [Planctomycetes bacterium]|nr:DUF1788 domain-containing protein [Planctomycetota bacterium]
MGRIEDLAGRYQSHISAPWQRNLAGAQRTIFVVHDKADERKLRAKLELFELHTRQAGCGWKLFDFTGTFAHWMSGMDYREAYFEGPDDLPLKLQSDFVQFAAEELRKALTADDVNSDTVVAVHGVASLFGFTKVSLVLKEVEHDIRGRLVLFFPGEFDDNNYRLLDARDGWNYLAVAITLHSGALEQ